MMRLCWGKASSFDVDADAEDAALKKVDDDSDDDVPFRRRRRKRARDEMRDMMMMMMIRRDMMNFCGGKILNCFYENHQRHKKYATGGNSHWSRMDSRCTQRVLTGAALGGAVGGAVGACYGTYEAFAYKVRVFVNSRVVVSTSSLSPFSLYCSQTLTH